MKNAITIGILAIVASIGLTAISGPESAFAQTGCEDSTTGECITGNLSPEDASDWGEVSSSFGQTGDFGSHSSNPIPDPEGTAPQDINREVPRGGVGNQEPGKHPAFHAQQLCTDFPGAPGCSDTPP